MKNERKTIYILIPIAIILAAVASIVVIVVYTKISNISTVGWGDSDGGRPSYTLEEINRNVLGDRIVFNSISDGVIGNEKNFVGARENTGINADVKNIWQENEITVENGKEYLVRLYVHNNNLGGENAAAENVRVFFSIPQDTAKTIPVYGFITSDNASPSEYWDGVLFTSNHDFRLEYVYGSAIIENNGFALGENGNAQSLSDNIVTSEGGVLIGYDALDGRIPGCYQYACYVCIRVKAVFEPDYMIECKARLEGGKEWSYNVQAKVGDRIEYQIQYKNINSQGKTQNNVFVRDILPESLRYIEGSTVLYNADHEAGMILDTESDDLTTDGINIGNYGIDANAYIRFTVEVIDESLEPGSNALVNWAKGTVDDTALSDYAVVMVNKE